MTRLGGMTIQQVPTDDMEPNPWNPNRMDAEMFAKLRAYVKREGLVEPLIVRKTKGKHQLLGGYHRWMIAKELGYETIPCVVLKISEKRAKILTVNLNEMKGQAAPHLLAELIHDLNHDVTLEDLATQLPYDLANLEDMTDLLRIPDGLDLELEEEATVVERDRMKVMSFPLSPDQHVVVTRALDQASGSLDTPSKGAALVHVAERFLGGENDK